MAYIRNKVIAGKTYHYLVKSVRREGKPRQEIIAYLGQFDNIEDAYVSGDRKLRRKLEPHRNPADKMETYLLRAEAWYERSKLKKPKLPKPTKEERESYCECFHTPALHLNRRYKCLIVGCTCTVYRRREPLTLAEELG